MFLIAFIAVLAFLDIKNLKTKDRKKTIFVYIGLMLVALVLGTLYFANEYGQSLTGMVMQMLNIKE